MTPWIRLDLAQTPDGTRLELMQRGPDFSIRANGQLLMNSRVHGSEEALAELALAPFAEHPAPHVLVGGLGCGYTLAATLARLPRGASVSVAEIVPAVVRWNRDHLGQLNGHPLDDPRTRVIETDICALFRAPAARYDAILLDVDNGPRAVARHTNAWLYTPQGLAAIHQTLNPSGILALWSAGPEVGFTERLRRAHFQVDLRRVRAHPSRPRPQHLIWLATKQ